MNQPPPPLQPPFHPAEDALLELMREGTLALEGLIPWSSNYTFLARIGEGADADPRRLQADPRRAAAVGFPAWHPRPA